MQEENEQLEVEIKSQDELAGEKKIEAERHRQNAKDFRVELKRLEDSKARFDQDRQQQVGLLLDDHEGKSAKGLLDKLLQMKDPQNTQLSQNIDKIEAAVLSETRKAGKLELEVREIYKEVDRQRFDGQAKVAFETQVEFIAACKKAEVALDAVRTAVFACEDPRFFLRGVDLGFEKIHEVIFDSVLSRDYIGQIGLQEVLERIANLGDSYGKPLIQKANNRLRNVPLVRDGSVLPSWMSGRDS